MHQTNQPWLSPGRGASGLDEMKALSKSGILPEELPDVPIVVNPRGQRPGSLRQDVFFQSIPLVIEKIPQALFICPNLAGDGEAEHWVELLGIQIEYETLAAPGTGTNVEHCINKAWVFVSPSIHDGTPNSLLEAMASGCFPVVGNIESMQEWVKPGCQRAAGGCNLPTRPGRRDHCSPWEALIYCAAAKNENARIIAERATYERCMAMAEAFYYKIGRGISKVEP